MDDLLAGSDSEVELRINKSYARAYNDWRGKEHFQKLKSRYGEETSESEESSSEDDENAKELTADFEKSFFTTLSCLKNKDPCIYDEKVQFFKKEEKPQKSLEKKEKPFVLRDFERKIMVEHEGKFSEDEEVAEEHRAPSPSYVQEIESIKASFKDALQNSDEEDENGSNLLTKRIKSQAEIDKEECEYREWLKGRKDTIEDKNIESDLKYLHDYWNDPKLNPNEAFLRDYILNRKFLDQDDDDYIPSYNEVVHDSDEFSNDEENIETQEQFERKYNFRFEEPDTEFIKTYPRNIENSVRRKDTRRARHRTEVKERKKAEKLAKKEEIKMLKALKKKEILEKIEKIKEVTGNSDIAFKDEDLDADFNPEEHDKKMNQFFNDEYFDVEENEKPLFPDLDEEMQIENWEHWKGDNREGNNEYNTEDTSQYEPHCEDPDFNMDCEYDSKAQLENDLVETSKGKRKRRVSKFAHAVSKAKPVFDPSDKRFEEYVDEYYKLDCEDVIGDLHCRFKYRKTVPNNYGLTLDEILRADEKELNRWCSLKKVVKYKPEAVELYDVKTFAKKARDERLKRKILPSLYVNQSDEHDTEYDGFESNERREDIAPSNYEDTAFHSYDGEITEKEKRKVNHDSSGVKKMKNNQLEENMEEEECETNGNMSVDNNKQKLKRKRLKKDPENHSMAENTSNQQSTNYVGKKKKGWKKHFPDPSKQFGLSDTRLEAYGIKPKRFKSKLIYKKSDDQKRMY